MKILIIIVKAWGYLWITLGVIGIFIYAAKAWMNDGFSAAQQLLSPFEIDNWLIYLAVLGPGLAALSAAKSLSEKHATQSATPP